uniref:PKHD1 like 1, tandem duplicate 2 n=1 Tax=Astyanax mexicanus TaxID=7994 RepID=W5KUJ5_ASTMX
GSTNGATRLTIQGQGFAQQSQFNLNPSDPNFGNAVTFVSQTASFPCDVERDASLSTKITCYTRPMPEDNYQIRVTVDGVPIPVQNTCYGIQWYYWCMFYPRWYYTPSIQSITPLSGLPGTQVTLRGRIYTDVYGSNTFCSLHCRAYMGGMPCVLLKPNSDELYGLKLDSIYSDWGYMSCKMTGSYVGHHNLSYILDSEYGRSLPDFQTYSVSALNKISMFQTYAEVTGVSPSEGSLLGGTLLTIQGNYFDETDQPAEVLVGGRECEVQSVTEQTLTCRTPAYEWSNATLFPGGRGFKMEMWNNSSPSRLEDVLSYNSSRSGYSVQWVDSLSYTWPNEIEYFVARFSGFFVPTETDNYYFLIKGDDRFQLYFSQTGRPEDKVKIAYHGYWTGNYYSNPTQRSKTMRLEKGVAYYMEVLFQEYTSVASVDVGFFKEKSPFTAQQTMEAVNEKQSISATYDIRDEKQVVSLEGWSSAVPVEEIQTITVSSHCFSLNSCDSSYYALGYGGARTGPIPVSAPAEVVQAELNALWSITPDTVSVTKQDLDTQTEYNITFNSNRGDFEDLQYWTGWSDINITVQEIRKGRSDLSSFTLLWDGVPSSPLPYNASAPQVLSAVKEMVSAKCPQEILSVENSQVKYFRDYETANAGFSYYWNNRGTIVNDDEAFCGSWSLKNPNVLFSLDDVNPSGVAYGTVPLLQYGTLCLAYKGYLHNGLELVFTYLNSTGVTYQLTTTIYSVFEWKYTCVDLLAALQTKFPGRNHRLVELHLNMDGGDYYVDAVRLGKAPMIDLNVVVQRRRPPALADSGRFFQQISVQKLNSPIASFEITATPYYCASGFPLIQVGFLKVSMRISMVKDVVVVSQDNTTVTVNRTQRASPPLSGTFSVESFGQRVEGLKTLDISADDLKFALQGIPDLGQLSVTGTGDCKGHYWTIAWLTMPGSQPLLQINDSAVIGVNPSVRAQFVERGGLFKQRIMGDFLRVPTNKTQVQVFINGIPSVCSGDCGFTWSQAKTPTVTGISPSQGANSLGTVLTVSGSGFVGENASVQIGNVSCSVLQITSTSLTCTVGPARAGLYPVSVSFPQLGNALYQGGNPFNFTYQIEVTSINPTAGSVTGGTVITVVGDGFGPDTVAAVGNASCDVISVDLNELRCRVPAGSGAQNVTLESGGMSAVARDVFTYTYALTAIVTHVTPQTTPVFGNRTLNVTGINFENQTSGCSVYIGNMECEVLTWTNETITCLLPTLPPGAYNVSVNVGNRGYPEISPGLDTTIEYVLQVTGLSPDHGSLHGGTSVTITGSGFSPDLTDNTVSLGDTLCEVTAARENQLEYYGQWYAWSPSTVMASVGDTVEWKWAAPAFVTGLGYRVFSVANPSNTGYDEVSFISGNAPTPTGMFRHRFTAPGVYYFSSGFIDSLNQRTMQGVVNVRPREERSSRLQVTVAGFQALHNQARARRTPSDCVSSAECPGTNGTSDGFSFGFSSCATPTVSSITPDRATVHEPITLQGFGFSSIPCANEVTIGGASCRVTNSSSTEITCLLSPDSGLPVATPLPVQVRVNNLGTAMITTPSETRRRMVVLPVVDSVSPSTGSTTGGTRLLISGSGLSNGMVSVAGIQCTVVSRNYTQVVCDTSPAPASRGGVAVSIGAVISSCGGVCSYIYSSDLTPQISSVNPNTFLGNRTTVVVSGSGFASNLEDVKVFAGNTQLEVTEVADANITLSVEALPAGPQALKVVVMSRGLASGNAMLTSVPFATLSPTSGSLAGGTLLMFTGNGFVSGNTSVTLGTKPCSVVQVTPRTVQCVTRASTENVVQVSIQVLGVRYPSLSYNYSREQTPKITSVSPTTGPGGTVITVSGSGFGSDPGLVSVNIDGVWCNVTSVSDSALQCIVGDHAGGTFLVSLSHQVKGLAQTQSTFTYELRLDQVLPNEGSLAGGAVVEIRGTGFDPNSSKVLICSRECSVNRNTSTSTSLYCEVPPNNGSQTALACQVLVLNINGSANMSNGYTYRSSLTPNITDVSPRRGGTAGGTVLTITGSGFSAGNVIVSIAGSVCDVQSANETHVICVTNAQPTSQLTKVRVQVGNRGIAVMDQADFFYIDVWSSRYTWGGQSPPEKGTFAVITKGQTILLDVSTPVLKMLLIQGGKLIFDEADIELQAENILITDGGALQIGTEDKPFQHKAIITLHGHLRSPEIPVYGAKTLGVREGVLPSDLHPEEGIPIPVVWTRLAQTANSGSGTLTLMDAVTWRVGDEIVIASTGHRHSQRENEVRTIAAVSGDGKTLTLTEPLRYTHLGVSVTLPDGTVFEGRAEVGVLTRNVVVRGSINAEWSDQIQACPDGFNTGEFATQTCFQGRFGEEVGSDQFGGCIMFHAPRPNENLAIGRIEYVEIFNAGQAFRLGRYPIHWHLMGDIKYQSYVRGCGIHQTYNRAVTIHNTHRLLVENNVIYNIMGGAFFIEDGIETGNILQYNLAVFVKQSTSLLNDDVTPAAYWVTNPNNIIRHNAAAGGTHFGYWYRMHDNPDGPSYDPSICQKRVPLGEFYNNTAHSQGWFGLWIFQDYFPVKQGSCSSYTPQPAVFRGLTSWNNQKGAEWVNVGSVQFRDFIMVNNEAAGVETKRIFQAYVSGWGLDGGAALVNSTLVGHVDELGLGSDYCTTQGVILPLDDGMSVINTKFMNFDRPSCAGIGVAKIDGTCNYRCGGWPAKFSGIQFYQTPNKASFRWEHEVVLIDIDGSLTGKPGSKVLPKSNLLDPTHCSDSVSWSAGVPGTVCDNTTSFHRLAFNNPSPSSLQAKDVILTNAFGTSVVPFLEKLVTHSFGWMALIPSDQTYNWYFRGASQISNISYSALFYGFGPKDYVIVNHNLTQSPDRFYITDNRNGSTAPLDPAVNINGDWYFNNATKNLFYMVSGRNSRARRSVDRSLVDISVQFSVYNCFYPNCITPTSPPPVSLAPLPTGRPSNTTSWFISVWKSIQEGDDLVIPAGMWLVLDIALPPLNKITILGVLEIPDTINGTIRNVVLNATYISIQGGRLIAGWPNQPFRAELQIILRGNHFTPEWPLPDGPNQGSKVLGVFGELDLYGKPYNVYHTKLASTAQAGSGSLSLQEPVDWKVGDSIVLSTTSYDPAQTETRTITAISANNRTLILDQPLTYTHIGGNYSVGGTSQSYRLAGEVGLLSRNIKIIGQDYPQLFSQSFGGRVLVGTFSYAGATYRGKAQIRNVEFYHTGQEGWTDYSDPRYSLAFLDLGSVQNESYVKGCSFHHGFSPAIGIFGTDELIVDDSVIYHTVGEGIRVWGNNVVVRRNLVTLTLWPGSYNGRTEAFNFNWPAAIEANMGTNVVLQGNIVAGYERVGFRINGEPCPGQSNSVAQWQQNEAHGGLFGVFMNKDGLPGCSHIQGFTVWRSYDFGIYFQVSMSVIVSNVTLVDNGMGIMPLIYEPPSVTHAYSNKTVLIQNALIVGSSPDFDCSDGIPLGGTNMVLSSSGRSPRPLTGGRSGISWPTFESAQNGAPVKAFDGLMSYNAISGLVTVSDTTFVGFKSVCSSQTNFMFLTNPENEDLHHPIYVQRITKSDCTENAQAFIHRPNVGKVNPSDCVDMDCDGKKKSLLVDLDGTLLGSVGAVVPQSEYEWNGDPRHGVGDYRIPKVMLTALNGSRIPVSQIAPNKGVIRDSSCTYMSSWQAYKCFSMNYRMLVIESLDSDSETRRLSPVAVLGSGYIDLLNGPQDHGWCSGYTCQKRVSLFHSIVATNKSYDVFFTSTSPQKLRLMLLNAKPTESVVVAVFYSNPQRLDVYVNKQLVAPTNAQWNSQRTDYTLLEPTYTGQYVPKLSSPIGSNFFDPDYKMLYVLVQGSTPVEIRTSPVLFIAFNLPAMTEAEFFGDTLVANLAAFLRVPANMIRISKIIREGSARRRRAAGLTVQVAIQQPPTNQPTTNSTSDVEQFQVLKNITDNLGQAAVTGSLSQSIGFNVSSMGVVPPSPPPSDPSWSTVADQTVTREDPVVQTVRSVSSLTVVVEPVAGYNPGPLFTQPSIMAVDQQGECVSVGVTTLTITAVLKDTRGNEVDGLYGNTTIPFSSCWANYTDLAISTTGENMTLAFTLNNWMTQSRSFTVKSVPSTVSATLKILSLIHICCTTALLSASHNISRLLI